MSYKIKSKDSCFALDANLSFKTKVEEITYETSGLNWSVERRNIFLEDQTEIKEQKAIYSPEKDEVIDIAKDSYQIIQNSRLFELLENSFTGINYKIIEAGSIGNCKRVYLFVTLDEKQDYLVNGDAFKNHIVFLSSHDSSVGLEVYDVSLRLVCNNQLSWSRKNKGVLNFHVRHSKNAESRITNLEEQIEKLFEKRNEFYSSYEYLANRPMSLDRAEKILTGFLGTDSLSTRAENTVKEVHNLFVSGLGNSGKTYADLLNGVTQHFTHGNGKDPMKAYTSSQFGSGQTKKLDFWQAINDEDELNKLAKRGELLMV